MSTNLVPLLDNLESRAKAMPALLQQVLSDTSSLQSHLDASAKASRDVGLHLQGQTTDLKGKFTALDSRLHEERKRQTGRLSDASIGLRALEKQGRRHLTDLEDDRKATQSAVNKLCDRLGLKSGGLSKTLQDDIESQRLATNTGLNAIEKAHNRLATTFKKLLGELSNLDTAVKAAAQQSEGAVQRLLTGIQKAAGAADQSRQTFHTKATGDAKKFQEGLTQIHSQTLAKPTLGRTLRYSQDINTLKGSATRSLMSVKSGVDTHDTKASQAALTFERGYREHESNSNGKATAARRTLMSADGELDNAWKKIPLDSEGNKDDRNLLQKAWDFPGYVAHKAWEFGAWAIKGVSEFVAKYHKEILVGLAAAAVVVGAVMLAPIVLPVLMAGASAAITAIGSGVSAGMTMAGSAMAGIGPALAGLKATVGSTLSWMLTAPATASASAPLVTVAAMDTPLWLAAAKTGLAGAGYLAANNLPALGNYAKQVVDTGDWSVKIDSINLGFGATFGGGQDTNITGKVGAGTSVGEVGTGDIQLGSIPNQPTESPVNPKPSGVSQATLDEWRALADDPNLSTETREKLKASIKEAEQATLGEGIQVASIGPLGGPPGGGSNIDPWLLVPDANKCAVCKHGTPLICGRCASGGWHVQPGTSTITNAPEPKPPTAKPTTPGSRFQVSDLHQSRRAQVEATAARNPAGNPRPLTRVPVQTTPATPPRAGLSGTYKNDGLNLSGAARDNLSKLGNFLKENGGKLLSQEHGTAQVFWEVKVAAEATRMGMRVLTKVIPGVGWVMNISDAAHGYYYLYNAATGNWDAIPASEVPELSPGSSQMGPDHGKV